MTARSVPVLRSWIAGETDTGSYMQTNLKLFGDFVLSRPMLAVRQTTGQTIGTANTMVTFDVEDADTDGFHDPTTNNTRMLIPTGLAGWYDVIAGAVVAAPTAAMRIVAQCYINGSAAPYGWVGHQPDGTASEGIQFVTRVYLNVGDYLEFGMLCSVAKALSSGAGAQPYLLAKWASR